jgi:cyclopropane fatty-acyl-phospholipid synthase-like methyltransferase
VETPDNIVTLMLDLAEITDSDYVIDLGTGDGRIVIGAVKRGATGLGVDLDPQRIEEARLNADKAGVSDRVKFEVADLFQTDISAATVVTLFLNSEVNMRLRPALFEQLKPGTRVVSHNFDMEDWQPDRQEQLMLNANNNFYIHDIFYWVIPADISGVWEWENPGEKFRMTVEQKFQGIKVRIAVNGEELEIKKSALAGDSLDINAVNANTNQTYRFNGQIADKTIKGSIQSGSTQQDWSAYRTD